jgi:hypothetical protein
MFFVRFAPTRGQMRRIALVGSLITLAACSRSGPTPIGPPVAAGGVVIVIGAASVGERGCNTFTPDTATATAGQPVQWRNTTSDSVSLQVVEYVETVVFVTVPPNELSSAQTGFAPGTVLYGPTSCDSLNAYLTIKQ